MILRALVLTAMLSIAGRAQAIIDFESAGLKYKAMTLGGVTVMFSLLPMHIRDYAIVQVAVSNGSSVSWTVKARGLQFRKARRPNDPGARRQDGRGHLE